MKKKEENLITWKIKYTCEESLLPIIKQYNSLLKFTYNRLKEQSLTFPELNALQKCANHCEQMNSWLRTSAEYEAKAILKANPKGKAIFGGKNLFIKRCQRKITNEEFNLKKLVPLYSIGEANQKGNRLFRLSQNNTVTFNLNNHKYDLQLHQVGSNRAKWLSKLVDLQESKQAAITYKVDLDYIYITFDYNLFKTFKYTAKQNRVIAIDLNPNSIGWSVVDWKD